MGEGYVPEDARNFSAPKPVEAKKGPDMYDFGGDHGGKTFQGIDLGVTFPPRGGELYSFRIDASANADGAALRAVQEVLDGKTGTEIIGDSERGVGNYLFKGDPREFFRTVVIPEAIKKLDEGAA